MTQAACSQYLLQILNRFIQLKICQFSAQTMAQ